MSNFRFIRRIIYSLKKRYSFAISVYRIISTDTNIPWGEQTQEITPYPIRKAIVLNTKEMQSFAYDLAYIAANKNFTYGGLYDIGTRLFIIDGKDISTILQDDVILYNHIRYEIKEIQDYHKGWLVIAKELKGQSRREIFTNTVEHSLALSQFVAETVA